MTDPQKRLIASLRFDPAFVALLDLMDQEVKGMLDMLQTAEITADILRITRLWQVASRLTSHLRIAPEAMHEAIAQESVIPDKPTNHWGLDEDEDMVTRPNRPIPPPYQEAVK
jgi:hypothetical protein